MKLIIAKDIKNNDIAINVDEIRAFYQYINKDGIRESYIIEVDVGSPKTLLVKKSFLEFKKLITNG